MVAGVTSTPVCMIPAQPVESDCKRDIVCFLWGWGRGGGWYVWEIKMLLWRYLYENTDKDVGGTQEKTEGETVDEPFNQLYLLVFYCHLAALSVVVTTDQ